MVGILAIIGAAVMAFVYTTVIPAAAAAIVAMAPIILVMALIGGAAYLLYEAWTNNWGGIQEKLTAVWAILQPVFEALREWIAVNIPLAMAALKAFWDNTLMPTFEIIRSWLAEKIPAAIQVLTDFWTNTLLPAIQDVWGFIQGDLIPLFTSLWNLLSIAGTIAIQAITGLWENVLLPALRSVWAFIQSNLIPIFQGLVDKLRGPVGSALQWFKDDLLSPVQTALGGISGAVQGVIGWVDRMADRLRSISLPDWLTPGSPTPFEMGLRGISAAMKQMNTMALPQFQANLAMQGVVAPGYAAAGNTMTTSNRTYNLNIHTSAPVEPIIADFAILEAMST